MGSETATPLIVALGNRSYSIDIVDGPIATPSAHGSFWTSLFERCRVANDIAFVTNETIAPLYGDRLQAACIASGRRLVPIVVPDGERFKTATTLEIIHEAMLEARLGRDATVFALGGGVIGDLAGFAAATYQRGVPIIQIPTTLLAQVDSSVGGKTGINHRLGKNMIGAFHQPSAVVIDLATLVSLPAREYAAGLAEVVKYGASLDPAFFAWLEANLDPLMARERSALAHAIRRSCELKAEIVGSDERESGRRALLNFGHTFGHAIEGATGYGTWLHGEAVAIGMVMAAHLSQRLGLIDASVVDRITELLHRFRLPVEPPRLSLEDWLRWMSTDKKAEGGRLRFVVLEELGSATVTRVDDDVLATVLRATRIAANVSTTG